MLTVHDLLPHDTGEAHRGLYKRLYAEMDALICHSAHIRERLVAEFAVAAAKVSVIPHGPFFYDLPTGGEGEVRRALEVADGQEIVLWQGIIFPYKGVDLLLAAWKRVEAATEALTLGSARDGRPRVAGFVGGSGAGVGAGARAVCVPVLLGGGAGGGVPRGGDRGVSVPGDHDEWGAGDGIGVREGDCGERSTGVPGGAGGGRDGDCWWTRAIRRRWRRRCCGSAGEPGLRERLEQQVGAMRFGEQTWAAIAEATAVVYARVLGD